MSKKRNKSDSYQYQIVEISVDPALLSEFPFAESLGAQLNMSKYSEHFEELRDSLWQRVLVMIHNGLTNKQSQIVLMRLEGKTQIQISEELNVNQSTVHKALMGNIDYANNKKRYGGAIKKLRKLCGKDVEIQKILEEMESLRAKDGEVQTYRPKFDQGFDDDF